MLRGNLAPRWGSANVLPTLPLMYTGTYSRCQECAVSTKAGPADDQNSLSPLLSLCALAAARDLVTFTAAGSTKVMFRRVLSPTGAPSSVIEKLSASMAFTVCTYE